MSDKAGVSGDDESAVFGLPNGDTTIGFVTAVKLDDAG
jgi:hypothetical protein